MSLSTITHNDILPKHKQYFKQDSTSLQTRDIEGAQSRLPGYKFINKPEYTNYTADIDRAQPATLHPAINRPQFRLMTEDIEFAKPNARTFKTTRTGQPMEPVYNLPKFEVRPITPPKFIRDSMNPADIEGARPDHYFKWETRDAIGVADIDGARPKPEKLLNKPDLVNPTDIISEGIFRSTRSVNPLMPQYAHRDEEGKLSQIGFVDGSRPRELVRNLTAPHSRNFTTKDIDGARTGTVGVGPLGSRDRKEARSPTDISDIDGAKAGSLRKGISTMRQVNPIWPQYKLPGASSDQPKTAQPVNAEAKPPTPKDPAYATSIGHFYGTERPVVKSAGVPKSPPNKEFEISTKKFYMVDGDLSPTSKALELQKAADKFFTAGPPERNVQKFEQVHNPGTIHRARRRFNMIDPEAPQYLRDTSNFFGGSQADSRPQSVQVSTPDPVRVQSRGASRNSEGGYHFSLSREQIKAPEASQIASNPPSSSQSKGSRNSVPRPGPSGAYTELPSVLRTSAQKVFSTS
jgi:hypothetical protein